MKYVGISDKILNDWLQDKEYMGVSDEAEAIAVCAGAWIASKQRWTAFMSADGFMNTLNYLTSWIIPEGIEMNIVISIGRTEPAHRIATEITEDIIKLLQYDPSKIDFQYLRKES